MAKVTLEQIHKDLTELKRDLKQMKSILREDFELAADVLKEIAESRKRPASSFISNEELRKEFG